VTTRVLAFLRQNAIALLALFVALGGTGYAAVAIRNHSITPIKFDRRTLGGYVRGWVRVSAAGKIVAEGGRWKASMDSASPGHYELAWNGLPDTGCTSLGSIDASPSPGSVAVPGSVVSGTFVFRHKHIFTAVYTYSPAGQQTPLPFDLAIFCATPR
jgi:hypothetical protein